MNTPLHIEEFIKLTGKFPVIDVRSPGEFEYGHIPGAHSVPLFDNEERARVGTAYKQIGRQKAIEIGFELVGPKLKSFITQVQEIVSLFPAPNPPTDGSRPQRRDSPLPTVLVHCWRGGMRSSNFAHLLNTYGYNTHTLEKGYKAYRNFVINSFEKNAGLLIIGGETGSGKTEILKKISTTGEQIIDLEDLAHHKGSAFGALGEKPQPTQEQFENNLALCINKLDLSKRTWIEDESHSIGRCYIPNPFWERMKAAPILRVSIPKKERIERLMNDYGNFSKEELGKCILNIERRLGPQHAKHALEELEKGNLREVADITLAYYDKAYNYNHEKRNMKDVFFIECETADAKKNAEKIVLFADTKLKKEYV